MRYVVLAVASIIPGPVLAQAFGVEPGTPISRYSPMPAGSGTDPYYFQIKVPQPNKEFESYVAYATPATGVCQVTALGRTHTNDDYGSKVRTAFTGLRAALRERYGNSEDFDFIKHDALWDEPREWVWSIYKDERTLTSFWTTANGSALPQGVKGIMLDTRSVRPTSGAYVVLTYEFDNYDQCTAIMDKRDNRGL